VLASRIIPVILAKGQQAVKGKAFDSWRSVGQLRQAIRVYEMRQVDEVVLLDISATPEGKEPNVAFVKEFAGEFFCPVAVGGGVRTVEHFRQLLAAGADKVVINTAAVDTPELISEAAHKFGRQAVVVSIDVRNGEVVAGCGKNPTGFDPPFYARCVERLGAGEILLNSVDRDGTLSGYDLDMVESVSGAVDIPVIACGGAGSYEDFRLAIRAGAHAVAAGALWHFTDSTPAAAAEYLHGQGIPVRRKIAA
jgi:cyclase